jgi:hypothetical protein
MLRQIISPNGGDSRGIEPFVAKSAQLPEVVMSVDHKRHGEELAGLKVQNRRI